MVVAQYIIKKIIMYTFFDTETNGLPKDYKASMFDVDNWPRVIQLGWILLSEDLKTKTENKFFIKPDGWVVPKEDFWANKGYNTARCEAEGNSDEDRSSDVG